MQHHVASMYMTAENRCYLTFLPLRLKWKSVNQFMDNFGLD